MCPTGIKSTKVLGAASLFALIFFGFSADVCAQTLLPPKVLADKYLMQAEQLLEKKDYDGALGFVDKILALQKEHGFSLRDEFHFKRAKIAYEAGFIPIAIEAVSVYLVSGNEGAFYKDALVLLIKAEEEMQEVEITPDRTCAGKAVGSSCWMALSNHTDCYVWNPSLHKNATATWTGACSGKTASGQGTLTWTWAGDDSLETQVSTGRLRNGRFDGEWIIRGKGRFGGDSVKEGTFVSGRKHGTWVTSEVDGPREKLTYKDGIKHGPYVYRNSPLGQTMSQGWKGEYVQGEEDGVWLRFLRRRPGEQCESAVFRAGDQVTEWHFVSDSECDF